jgi:hypothetical protein
MWGENAGSFSDFLGKEIMNFYYVDQMSRSI